MKEKFTANPLVVALLLFVLSWYACTDNTGSASTTSTQPSDTVVYSPPIDTTPVEATAKWSYEEQIDEMDNTKRKLAFLSSDNTVVFDFPYGESGFGLTIRKHKGNTDIMMNCSKCQFIIGYSDDARYRVKFDDQAPFSVPISRSTSGDSDIVFLGNESKLISKLKKSEKLIIEAEFYNRGFERITFSTKGFEWE